MMLRLWDEAFQHFLRNRTNQRSKQEASYRDHGQHMEQFHTLTRTPIRFARHCDSPFCSLTRASFISHMSRLDQASGHALPPLYFLSSSSVHAHNLSAS